MVQCDSVEGYERNTYDILSAHIVARAFQIYLAQASCQLRQPSLPASTI